MVVSASNVLVYVNITAGRVSVKNAVDVSVIIDVSISVLDTVIVCKLSCVSISVDISVCKW